MAWTARSQGVGLRLTGNSNLYSLPPKQTAAAACPSHGAAGAAAAPAAEPGRMNLNSSARAGPGGPASASDCLGSESRPGHGHGH